MVTKKVLIYICLFVPALRGLDSRWHVAYMKCYYAVYITRLDFGEGHL